MYPTVCLHTNTADCNIRGVIHRSYDMHAVMRIFNCALAALDAQIHIMFTFTLCISYSSENDEVDESD